MSGHLMLGLAKKSSATRGRCAGRQAHPARALPFLEGVPGDDPPSAKADGRNDALFQHRVDREPPDGEPVSDFGDQHSAAHIVTAPLVSHWESSGTRNVAAVITATPY